MLTGTVLDASNQQPVLDVAVTVTSPSLQGERIVVTDASGSYRVPQLPPGEYTVRLEKETYRPYSRGGVALRLSSTIRLNVELLPERVKLAETIDVVGKAPTVDVGSTTTGLLVGPEMANRLALNPPGTRSGAVRSFENLALAAPGVHADGSGTAIHGATSFENRFQIDGLSVNSSVDGINDTLLCVEFVKEVNIATGGYMPEFGRAMGGIFDVITKSGSNELHGSVFGSITPGALEGPRAPVRQEGTTIRTDAKLSMLRDFGFDIGGPIVRDRLWFYAGMNIALQDNQITRTLNRLRYETNPDGSLKLDGNGNPIRAVDGDGFQLADPIPGTERVAYASKDTFQYIGKLTWQISPEHTLTISSYGTPSTSGGNGRYSLTHWSGETFFGGTSPIGPGAYTGHARMERSSIHDLSLNLSSAFLNKRLLVDAMLGWHHAKLDVLPVDGSGVGSGEGLSAVPGVLWIRGEPGPHSIADFEELPPGAGCDPAGTDSALYCPVTSYRSGGPGHTAESVQNRVHGKVVGTYLLSALGPHVIKAGFDLETAMHRLAEANSGGVWFLEAWDGMSFDVFHYGSVVGPNEVFVPNVRETDSTSTIVGGFVQDSWNILDWVTANAGFRYDAQVISTSDGTGITMPAQWSPRVGAIYDFTRRGRSKIFASYARYYENVSLNLADNALIANPFSVSSVSASVCDPRDPSKLAACDAPENRLNLGAPYDPNGRWTIYGGNRTPVDPLLRAQSSDEFVIGGEYEIFPDGRAGVTYTHRWLNDVIEDMSRDEGTTYFIGNPGHGATSDFPKAKRDYDALTLLLQKSFSSQWLAQASYTLSYLRGNYAGGANLSTDFDVIALLPNRDGPLPGDRTHAVKLYGAKEFSLPKSIVLNLGVSYQGLSGTPLNVISPNPLFESREAFILPRGAGGRLPWVHTIDANLTVGYRIHKSSQLSISLDAFNLFNFQTETNRDQSFTFAGVRPIVGGSPADLPNEGETACADAAGCRYKLVYSDGAPFDPKGRNPNYGNPTAYQNPRRFRIGAKVTF